MHEWTNDNGQLHRLDGAAREWADGSKEWYINGKLHRIDGPAYERINGINTWYLNGKIFRLDGPAYDEFGYNEWYVNYINISNISEILYIFCEYPHNKK